MDMNPGKSSHTKSLRKAYDKSYVSVSEFQPRFMLSPEMNHKLQLKQTLPSWQFSRLGGELGGEGVYLKLNSS